MQGRGLDRIVFDFHAFAWMVDEGVEWVHAQDGCGCAQHTHFTESNDLFATCCCRRVAIDEQQLIAVSHVVEDLQQITTEQRIYSFQHGSTLVGGDASCFHSPHVVGRLLRPDPGDIDALAFAARHTPDLAEGQAVPFAATLASGLTPTVSSDNCSVKDGSITALAGEGTCTVTVMSSGGNNVKPLIRTFGFDLKP